MPLVTIHKPFWVCDHYAGPSSVLAFLISPVFFYINDEFYRLILRKTKDSTKQTACSKHVITETLEEECNNLGQ